MVLEKLKEENTVIALIGASNDKQKYGNKIYCDLRSKGYNVVPINTKEKLKSVLFNFHNSVNQRTGKQVVGLDILKKYNRANIKQIFDLFEARFFYSYIGRRHFDDWIKNEVRGEYYKFYNIVRTKFI